MLRRCLTGLWIACLAGTVAAQAPNPPATKSATLFHAVSGYTYFNKPGANTESHNRDLEECINSSFGLVQTNQNFAGVLPALIYGMADDQGRAANIENCMVVDGWRVVRLPDTDGAMISKLDRAAQTKQLSAWIGAEEPFGTIARTWGNEIGRPSSLDFSRAHYFGGNSLSIALFDKKDFQLNVKPPEPRLHLLDKKLNFKLINSADTESAIIIINEIAANPRSAPLLNFSTTNDKDLYVTNIFQINNGPFAVKVPPGIWRIDGFGNLQADVSLCLGSPAFEVKAGEIVFAGTFDLDGLLLGPDMSPEPARTFLLGYPDIAQKLQLAVWRDGAAFRCGNSRQIYTNIYAYRLPTSTN